MKIRDVLKAKGSQVYAVAPHRTVREALALLVQFHVGAIPCALAGESVARARGHRDDDQTHRTVEMAVELSLWQATQQLRVENNAHAPITRPTAAHRRDRAWQRGGECCPRSSSCQDRSANRGCR